MYNDDDDKCCNNDNNFPIWILFLFFAPAGGATVGLFWPLLIVVVFGLIVFLILWEPKKTTQYSEPIGPMPLPPTPGAATTPETMAPIKYKRNTKAENDKLWAEYEAKHDAPFNRDKTRGRF